MDRLRSTLKHLTLGSAFQVVPSNSSQVTVTDASHRYHIECNAVEPIDSCHLPT
jgi:hypothetical protein